MKNYDEEKEETDINIEMEREGNGFLVVRLRDGRNGNLIAVVRVHEANLETLITCLKDCIPRVEQLQHGTATQ